MIRGGTSLRGIVAYLVENERAKLTATAFNTSGVACWVVGVLTPIASLLAAGNTRVSSTSAPWLIQGAIAWLMVGIALHFLARSILGRLRE
jgi:hypothetical protein